MLYLIGLGLADQNDISLKGLNAIKSCARVYLEWYTSKLQCTTQDLEKVYGKKIHMADREFVEDATELLDQAMISDIALLVMGDPLCATTHWDILERAKKLNIRTEVIHNASIISAVGATGLQVYKFGKITSIPFPRENFEPETFYDVIKANKAIGAHTLLLLDLWPKENKFMSVNEAIELIRKIERKRGERVLLTSDLCVGVARLGAKDEKIIAGTAVEVSDADFGPAPHALIIPGQLHFMEEDALKTFMRRE